MSCDYHSSYQLPSIEKISRQFSSNDQIQNPLSKKTIKKENQQISQVIQDHIQAPVSVSKRKISATKLSSMKNENPPLEKANSGMKLKNDLGRIASLRTKNLASINELRKRVGKRDTEGTIDQTNQDQIIKDLNKIQETVAPLLKQSKKKAKEQGGFITESVNIEERDYKLTIDKRGNVYLHVPKSSFARGGTKEVKVAIDLKTKEMVVRALEKKPVTPEKTYDLSSNPEVRVAQLLKKHPHIGAVHTVTLKRATKFNRIGTISPFFDGGDLASKVIDNESKVLFYGIQAAKGLKAMHKKGLVHKDVKPENMMLKGEHLFVIDFGTVAWETKDMKNYKEKLKKLEAEKKKASPNSNKMQYGSEIALLKRDFRVFVRNSGTPAYERKASGLLTSYELNHPKQAAQKGDVYSFGISLLHMLYSPEINQKESLQAQQELLMKKVNEFKKSGPENDTSLQSLIRTMIGEDAKKIPTMSQVVKQLKKIQKRA